MEGNRQGSLSRSIHPQFKTGLTYGALLNIAGNFTSIPAGRPRDGNGKSGMSQNVKELRTGQRFAASSGFDFAANINFHLFMGKNAGKSAETATACRGKKRRLQKRRTFTWILLDILPPV